MHEAVTADDDGIKHRCSLPRSVYCWSTTDRPTCDALSGIPVASLSNDILNSEEKSSAYSCVERVLWDYLFEHGKVIIILFNLKMFSV